MLSRVVWKTATCHTRAAVGSTLQVDHRPVLGVATPYQTLSPLTQVMLLYDCLAIALNLAGFFATARADSAKTKTDKTE